MELPVTLDQLRVFIEVAEREHMTRAAAALELTQSAVSATIATLESAHRVKLFHRVGRGIRLTEAGHALLAEARAAVARVDGMVAMLREFGGLERGRLRLAASQTVGSYWLPPRMHAFRQRYPGIELSLEIGNTGQVARRVVAGEVELGFVEGRVDHPALVQSVVGDDALCLVNVFGPRRPVDARWLRSTPWVLREPGSGTRAAFESLLRQMDLAVTDLEVAFVLPSNESVLAAAIAGAGAALLSDRVVRAAVASGALRRLPLTVPARPLFALQHGERYRSRAAETLVALARQHRSELTGRGARKPARRRGPA